MSAHAESFNADPALAEQNAPLTEEQAAEFNERMGNEVMEYMGIVGTPRQLITLCEKKDMTELDKSHFIANIAKDSGKELSPKDERFTKREYTHPGEEQVQNRRERNKQTEAAPRRVNKKMLVVPPSKTQKNTLRDDKNIVRTEEKPKAIKPEVTAAVISKVVELKKSTPEEEMLPSVETNVQQEVGRFEDDRAHEEPPRVVVKSEKNTQRSHDIEAAEAQKHKAQDAIRVSIAQQEFRKTTAPNEETTTEPDAQVATQNIPPATPTKPRKIMPQHTMKKPDTNPKGAHAAYTEAAAVVTSGETNVIITSTETRSELEPGTIDVLRNVAAIVRQPDLLAESDASEARDDWQDVITDRYDWMLGDGDVRTESSVYDEAVDFGDGQHLMPASAEGASNDEYAFEYGTEAELEGTVRPDFAEIETGLELEQPDYAGQVAVEYIAAAPRVEVEQVRQIETFVRTMPEAVKEQMDSFFRTADQEIIDEVETVTLTIAAIADRLHVLHQQNRGDSEEAQQIEVVLYAQYEALLTQLNLPTDEESIEEFIRLVCSGAYEYEMVHSREDGIDPMREHLGLAKYARGNDSDKPWQHIMYGFDGMAQFVVRQTAALPPHYQ